MTLKDAVYHNGRSNIKSASKNLCKFLLLFFERMIERRKKKDFMLFSLQNFGQALNLTKGLCSSSELVVQ